MLCQTFSQNPHMRGKSHHQILSQTELNCHVTSLSCVHKSEDNVLSNHGVCSCLTCIEMSYCLCFYRSEQVGGDRQQWCVQTRDVAANGTA